MTNKDMNDKLHIISWLLKDMFWCLQLAIPAIIMVFPTIGLMLYMIIKNPEDRLENLTVSSWIMMNILWMLNELKATQWPRWPIYIPMSLGIIFSILLIRDIYKRKKVS
jgi:hypothetical protein